MTDVNPSPSDAMQKTAAISEDAGHGAPEQKWHNRLMDKIQLTCAKIIPYTGWMPRV